MIGHLLIALALQLATVALLRSWWSGAAVASSWSIAREITQAEYRWIEAFGGGLRANMPWWGGLDPAAWPRIDQWMDWIVPTIAVCALAWIAEHRRTRR